MSTGYIRGHDNNNIYITINHPEVDREPKIFKRNKHLNGMMLKNQYSICFRMIITMYVLQYVTYVYIYTVFMVMFIWTLINHDIFESNKRAAVVFLLKPPAKNDTSWLPRSEIAKFYGNSEEHVADLWNSIREKVHPTFKPGVL